MRRIACVATMYLDTAATTLGILRREDMGAHAGAPDSRVPEHRRRTVKRTEAECNQSVCAQRTRGRHCTSPSGAEARYPSCVGHDGLRAGSLGIGPAHLAVGRGAPTDSLRKEAMSRRQLRLQKHSPQPCDESADACRAMTPGHHAKQRGLPHPGEAFLRAPCFPLPVHAARNASHDARIARLRCLVLLRWR